MGASTKTSRFAVGIALFGIIFVFIAFCSPYWLYNDRTIRHPKFLNLGLWEVCLNDFRDNNRFYDTRFTGCMWVFEEEYYIIHDFLLTGFYLWTQFFFTLCFTLNLLATFMTLSFLRYSRDNDRYILLVLTNGATLFISGLFGVLACSIFGANGDNRDWMPHWEHNHMGWSFALACLGSFALLPAGILFLVEARRCRYRQLNEIGTREASAYSIPEPMRKPRPAPSGHTDI